jgi:hypothetical protein
MANRGTWFHNPTMRCNMSQGDKANFTKSKWFSAYLNVQLTVLVVAKHTHAAPSSPSKLNEVYWIQKDHF